MAYQVNSINYGDYRYSVGDIVKISSSKEYMYAGIGNSYPNNMPGISQDTRKITSIWKQDSVGMVVLNPIGTAYVSGPQGYGGGYIRPEQIVSGSGGLKVKHYVSFNANGGSGAPGKQTKVYGSILRLSESKPTREGYTFVKWNTNKSGTGTSYNPGSEYGNDADVTLYAIWKANTWTVSYNANGGSGAPGNQTKTYGKTLTLSSTRPTRTNYNFVGWGTSPSSTTPSYQPGGAYTANSGITLYAIWSLAYTKPRISNLRVDRCTSNGTLSDEGTYAKVQFSWACDRTVSAMEIRWGSSKVAVSASGTRGNVNQIVNGSFNVETTYTITVYVADSGGNSVASVSLAPMRYLIDFCPDGVAFGIPAKNNGYVTFGYPLILESNKFIWSRNSDFSNFRYVVACKDDQDDFGNGSYDNNRGIVRYAGNAIQLYSKNNIEVKTENGYTFFNNNVKIKSTGVLELENTQILKYHTGTKWSWGRNHAMIRSTGYSTNFFCVAMSQKTVNGDWSIGTLYDDLYFVYTKDTDYSADNNKVVNIQFTPSGGAVFKDLADFQGQGIHINHGAAIYFRSGARTYSNESNALYFSGSGEYYYALKLGVTSNGWRLNPVNNGTLTLGGPSNRWGQIYSTTSSISTSDRNLKKDIYALSDKYEDFFKLLKPCSYKFIDGTSNRTHVGFISQDVEDAMKTVGFTNLDFAGFCKDQETKEVKKTRKVTKHNVITNEEELVEETYAEYEPIPDKFTYSLRYEEFIAINTAMIQKLMERVKKLEVQIQNGNESIKQ